MAVLGAEESGWLGSWDLSFCLLCCCFHLRVHLLSDMFYIYTYPYAWSEVYPASPSLTISILLSKVDAEAAHYLNTCDLNEKQQDCAPSWIATGLMIN